MRPSEPIRTPLKSPLLVNMGVLMVRAKCPALVTWISAIYVVPAVTTAWKYSRVERVSPIRSGVEGLETMMPSAFKAVNM